MFKFNSEQTSNVAEKLVALDLMKRGWITMEPVSRDCVYDLVVDRGIQNDRRVFETIQVKKISGNSFYTTSRHPGNSKNEFVSKNGKARNSYAYKDELIDWMVGVDLENEKIYYYSFRKYSRLGNTINVKRDSSQEFPIHKPQSCSNGADAKLKQTETVTLYETQEPDQTTEVHP